MECLRKSGWKQRMNERKPSRAAHSEASVFARSSTEKNAKPAAIKKAIEKILPGKNVSAANSRDSRSSAEQSSQSAPSAEFPLSQNWIPARFCTLSALSAEIKMPRRSFPSPRQISLPLPLALAASPESRERKAGRGLRTLFFSKIQKLRFSPNFPPAGQNVFSHVLLQNHPLGKPMSESTLQFTRI